MWLYVGCHLPIDHIAIVLDLDLAELKSWIRWWQEVSRLQRPPTVPPWRKSPSGYRPPIIGPTGGKVRRLHELGYTSAKIATILALDPAAVRDFLRRIRPVRGPCLIRPRSRDEQARLRPRKPRKKPPAPPPSSDPADWWRFKDDVGPDGLPLTSPAPPCPDPEPVHQAVQAPAELATRNVWTGSSDFQESRGKLSPADVLEIQHARAKGVSTGVLAKRFNVTRSTICYAANGRTFRDR